MGVFCDYSIAGGILHALFEILLILCLLGSFSMAL